MDENADRARLYGWISFACAGAAIAASIHFRFLTPSWIFIAVTGLAVGGVVSALIGIDARRASEDPRPSTPNFAIVFASLCLLGVLSMWFLARAPIRM